MNKDQLNRARQWFVALQEIKPTFITTDDYLMARALYENLNMPIPDSTAFYLADKPISQPLEREITEAMIDAGANMILNFDPHNRHPGKNAKAIYEAMEAARIESASPQRVQPDSIK